MCTTNKSVVRQGDITGFDDADVVEVQRPYDSAWGMYYDEFDDAKPDEIETWVKNHSAENESEDVSMIEYLNNRPILCIALSLPYFAVMVGMLVWLIMQ